MNKINFSATFNNKTGYSIASTNIGLQLTNLGCDLTLFPIGNITQEKNIQDWVINNHYKRKECDYRAKGLKLWHQGDLLEFPVCSERIGFPIFELNKFTKQECNSLNSLDRLIVCSKWAKQICLDNNILIDEKIDVCPLGVDINVFKPRVKRSDKYIFANIGKLTKNKGHDVLVEIFNKAFTKKDDVELWMFCDNPFLTPEQKKQWLKLYLDSPLGNKIKFFPSVNTQSELAINLMKADAAIFPARAEGWNLGLLECMSMGLPCITTNYSGHTEFCNKDNSFLVDITEVEPANDGIWFNGQGDWAKIGDKEIDQFVDYMRYCYKNILNTNEEGSKTGKKYNWCNSAEILTKIIWE